jgi:hypothetical protein
MMASLSAAKMNNTVRSTNICEGQTDLVIEEEPRLVTTYGIRLKPWVVHLEGNMRF